MGDEKEPTLKLTKARVSAASVSMQKASLTGLHAEFLEHAAEEARQRGDILGEASHSIAARHLRRTADRHRRGAIVHLISDEGDPN